MTDMTNFFLDVGQCSLVKHSETICGDCYCVVREPNKITVVLSDGLGSGVKANILSTLTSKILSTLIAKNLPLDECIYTVASTLPMCSERKIAYATFTVLQMSDDMIYLVQYDNPSAILLRQGKNIDYRKDVHFYGEKTIYESRFPVCEGDMIVLMSDGIINAGMGKNSSSGWKHEDVITFLEGWWSEKTSPKRMANCLCDAANDLSLRSVDDDTTVMVCKVIGRKTANVLIGPPQDTRDDGKVLEEFFSKSGKHIICGGTTSKIVAKYLGSELKNIATTATEKVPAISKLDGTDLVTEGFLTLSETVNMAESYLCDELYGIPDSKANDGASQLCRMLFEESTDVNIFFGTAENSNNSVLQMNLNTKLQLIHKLENLLKRQGKNVKINLC
jgi:hypothetical protein